jgi:hypothetical protein
MPVVFAGISCTLIELGWEKDPLGGKLREKPFFWEKDGLGESRRRRKTETEKGREALWGEQQGCPTQLPKTLDASRGFFHFTHRFES